MPMPRPVVHDSRSGRRGSKTVSRGSGLSQSPLLGCLQSALAQTLPSGAGYQIGDGAIPVVAPRRGVQGWATEASFTAQATLTNNANYGESNVRAGRSDSRVHSGAQLQPRRAGGCASTATSRSTCWAMSMAPRRAASCRRRTSWRTSRPSTTCSSSMARSSPVSRSINPFLPRSGVLLDQQPVHIDAGAAGAVLQGQLRLST